MEVVKEFDCSIISGLRGEQEQNELFRQGLSQKRWPNSKHNFCDSRETSESPEQTAISLAVDAAPYPINWSDKELFVLFGGYVLATGTRLSHPIRWGGDWNRDFRVKDENFRDLGHFELMEV